MSTQEKARRQPEKKFDEERKVWVTVIPEGRLRRLGIDNVRRVSKPRIQSGTMPVYPPKIK